MSNYKERYQPTIVGVNATVKVEGNATGGFLVATAGTISLTNLVGTVLMTPTPVLASTWIPIPFLLQNPGGGTGGFFICSGGASGTLGV